MQFGEVENIDMLTPDIDVVDITAKVRISGKVITRNMPYDTFIDTDFGEKHVEWINGVVIEMAGIDERHDALVGFLRVFFTSFLETTGGGRCLGDPMLMKLIDVPSSRASDIQVLLPDRLGQIAKNQVIGPANLVVEIVSSGSQRTDNVEKRREYELGGVPEYWIIDHEQQKTTFLQLNEAGLYEEILPNANGVYCSRSLKGLCFSIDILWRENLPGIAETMKLVADMLKDE